MACGYDTEQQLLPLAFAVVAGEESVANWGWFMQWLRKEVVGPGKITVISDQHLGIRAVFERPDFGWQELAGEAVHRYCTQHIAQNVYKNCHIKRIKTLFKQAARHKKPWRCEEYTKKKLTVLDRRLINSSEKQESCKEISQRNKCPTEGHEITETAIINLPQLRKCQPRNSIMRS
jgi:hypothetical protein